VKSISYQTVFKCSVCEKKTEAALTAEELVGPFVKCVL